MNIGTNELLSLPIDDEARVQKDLAGSRPDVRSEGARRRHAWHHEMMRTMPDHHTVDPMRTALSERGPFHARGCGKTYSERLKATGREAAAADVKRRHQEEFRG